MRQLVFSPAAQRDLERIADYVGNAAGPAIARELLNRVRGSCSMLAETPGEIGMLRSEILEGIRSFPTPPYVLFFRYSGSELQVARVLHERLAS